jgi:phytoene dehydrogenase-like protein
MLRGSSSHDALVIGGGHNGLVCAAYLARAGLHTAVLERRELVGGAAVTEEVWPGYRVSTAAYLISLLSQRIVRELNLARYGYHVYPIDPEYFAPFEDGSGILVWNDPRKTAEEISRICKPDAEGYLRYSAALDELAELIRPILYRVPPDPALVSLRDVQHAVGAAAFLFRRRRSVAKLTKMMTMSCADFLSLFFADERIKGALAPGGVIGMWGGPMSPGSAYVLLHHRMGEAADVGGAWGFVRGGMGGVSEAIASAARAAGAEIETNAEVTTIDVTGGRARGVTLTDGRQLRARVIASAIHPVATFMTLVGEQHLPAELADDIRAFRSRSPAAKVNLALSELPDFTARRGTEPGPQHPEIMVSPTLTYLEQAWDDVKYGRTSARPMIDCVIPSTKDSSIAPPGRHLMNCFVQYVPYQPADGPWDDAKRDALATSVIDTITQFAPNFKRSVTHRQVLTPYDLEQRFGLVGGNIFHGEMSLDQLFSLRPTPTASGYRTPIAGLYLCASGAHPGGGVMGIPGLNASRVIARDARHRQ